MLNGPTIEKLRQMRLYGMLEALTEQEEVSHYRELSFYERLGLIVDREYDHREHRRLKRRLKEASLKQKAQIEDILFSAERGIDRREILYLSEGQWIKEGHNIIITGPTGVGKSYIACALCDALIRRGYTGRYYQMSKLLRYLRVWQVEGSVEKHINALSKVDVMVMDDFLIEEVGVKETRLFFEVVDDRTEKGGMIFCSQIPVSGWYERIGDSTLADAILDRIVHNTYRIELKGESMRKRKQLYRGDGASIKVSEMVE
ncbi:MAG: AAA family ATPase [Nitrospirae bacterium]|nr:MAG: AAA family ATPase [Nitrospirota bacterium]